MKKLAPAIFFSLLLCIKLQAAINWGEICENISQLPEQCQVSPVYGGASNVNYHLVHEGRDYFVRFAPKTVESLYSNLEVEYEVLTLISHLNVSAKPYYYDADKRIVVTDFIHHDHEKIDLLDPAIRSKVFPLLYAIENSQVKIARQFQPCQDVLKLIETAKSTGCTTFSVQFYQELLPWLEKIEGVLANPPRLSLCHLDLHNKNIVRDGERYWIVDWEYAAMSHPFLVLASMASIERWDDQQMRLLLSDYMACANQVATKEDFQRLYLYRVACDLFWTVWNHVQAHVSTIDNPYPVWEKLFYDAAVERMYSTEFLEAMTLLSDAQKVQ